MLNGERETFFKESEFKFLRRFKMSEKILKLLLISFLCIGLSSIAHAQKQTGSLTGTVVDKGFGPLPGVSITISGTALMGDRTYITSKTGNFRFPALPPGIYTIACELQGFKKVIRKGIIIRVGKTITIQIQLEPTTIEEEVIVTAVAPVIDTTASKMSVHFTKDLLQNIPMSRDLYSVVNSVPGAISAGSAFQRTTSIHGSNVAGNEYNVDGVNMTDPVCGYPIQNISFDLYEEVEIEIGAHPAEVGNLSGAYINIITSSGGNEFYGTAKIYYFNESFIDKNFSDEQLDTLGISIASKNKSEKDFSLNIGGPLFKDKLWFFLGGRYLDTAVIKTNFPEDVTHTEYFSFAKLTFQLTKNIKLMGMFNLVDTTEPYLASQATPQRTPEATLRWEHGKDIIFTVQSNIIFNQNSFLDIRGSYVHRTLPWVKQPGATHQNYDRGTGMYTGAARFPEEFNPGIWGVKSSFTLFADDFLGGNHEFKTGAELEVGFLEHYLYDHDPMWTYTWDGSPYYYGGNWGLFYTWGFAPNRGDQIAKSNMVRYGFYAQDSWTIKNRLTLNLGLRFDSAHGNHPAQSAPEVSMWTWLDPVWNGKMDFPEVKDVLVFNNISPRLGLVFDIFGGGKTVAKASYSRYNERMMMSWINKTNPNGYSWQGYQWRDDNWNGELDPGVDQFYKIIEKGRTLLDPKEQYESDLKAPYWDEIILGIDHELFKNFRFGVSYIYKQQKNALEDVERNAEQNWSIPYTVTDPGYDGVFGTGDDQQLTIWDRIKFEPLYFTTPKDAWRKYQACEFIFEKRMSDRWQLYGSIVISKMYGTIGGTYGFTQAASAAFNTPNWMINREGRVDMDRPLFIKLLGTYQLPYGINLSWYFTHISGAPFTRTVNIYAPTFGSYVAVNAEPQGTRRTPSRNSLQLRLEKKFAFGDFGGLGLFLDVFNASNAGYIGVYSGFHGWIESDGSFTQYTLWHKAASVSLPRRIKVGVAFSF